jgi:carboxyl-terminal processing protease
MALTVLAVTGVVHGQPVPHSKPSLSSFEDVGASVRLKDVLKTLETTITSELVGLKRWRKLLGQHRPRIEEATSHSDFAQKLTALFEQCGISHLHYFPDADWRYWLFLGELGFDKPADRLEHIGIVPQKIDDKWYVRGILEGSPAAAIDMLVGDRLITVDNRPFHPVSSFRGKAGRQIAVAIERSPGEMRIVHVTPILESLHEAWLTAAVRSIRRIRHLDLDLAYMHAWSMFGSDEYRRLAELQPTADGLLLDFREGYGGSTTAVFRFLLGFSRQQPQWHKPVVILTSSDGTRSAKEIVAAASRARHKAKLVGTKTAGAVLPCHFYPAGRDAVLVAPTSWSPLEGHPIEPDVSVKRDIRYCAGSDVQLERAKEVLVEMIHAWPKQHEVTSADASPPPNLHVHRLRDVEADRLVETSAKQLAFSTYRSRWADTDNDGRNELILPSWENGVHIISSDGANIETLRFPDIQRPESVVSIVPAPLDGQDGWFIASSNMLVGTARQPTAALYSREGNRLWQFRPQLPDGVGAEMTTAAGDLDGDGGCELLVGLTTYKEEQAGANSWLRRDEQGYVLVLDTTGKLLCQRSVGDSIELLAIMQPSQGGDRPSILVGSRHVIRRFRFALGPAVP